MFNKGKTILKAFLYFVAAISIGLCVYAFVEGVTVITVESQQQQAAEDAIALVEKSDTETAKPCEEAGFWATYDVWGDTDTLYGLGKSEDAAEGNADKNISCDEPFEDGINQ